MTNPTTPDQGDERREFEAYAKNRSMVITRAANGPYIWNNTDAAWHVWQAARALSAARPVAQEAIPPIERDESMDRTYIPLPGGWEVQTQGKGSSFRLCNTESGHRWIVTDKHLHPVLEEMARDMHAAALAAPQPSQGARGSNPNSLRSIEAGQLAWDSLADVRQRGVGDV